MLVKLKANIPEIFLGIFLTVAIFAMGMTFESSYRAPSNQNTQANAEKGSGPEATNQSENKITDWLLVLFNGLLFGANLLLWRVTKTAADAAKKAADAADLSTKAVTVVERAYVYPVVITPGAIEQCIRAALDSEEEDVPAVVTCELTFKFKNFGKTPAVLKEAFVGFGVSPLGAEIGISIPEGVLGDSEETGALTSEMQKGITRRQAQHIGVYTGHICFTGTVTFYDIWDNENTTRFYFVWDQWTKRMTLNGVETKTKQKGEEC
jgi:hypothetical protein